MFRFDLGDEGLEEPGITDVVFKWLVILIIVAFVLALGWLACVESASASPQADSSPEGQVLKQELQNLQGWEPTRDRNVILKFQDRSFKHEILSVPTPMPQCGGVQVKGREVWLLTQEINPVLYIIAKEPNATQLPGEIEWTGLVGKTSFINE